MRFLEKNAPGVEVFIKMRKCPPGTCSANASNVCFWNVSPTGCFMVCDNFDTPLNSWQGGPILMPFEWVNKHTGRFVLRYNEAWYLVRWLQDRRVRTKLSFWNTKFLEKFSINLNFSNNYSLLSWSHLAMYQASLYLKTNLRVCLFTTSKGIKIGPPCQELRGVSK